MIGQSMRESVTKIALLAATRGAVKSLVMSDKETALTRQRTVIINMVGHDDIMLGLFLVIGSATNNIEVWRTIVSIR